jgi:hypothetical protein
MRALALLAVLAACGDSRIVLELAGEVPGGDRIDVLLLEPMVLAKRQIDNRTAANAADRIETVFYMAERARTTIAPIEVTRGLQLEIRDPGGPYVPLVAVRAGGQLVGLGLYNAPTIFAAQLGREHTAAAVAPVSDVTIYPVDFESAALGGATSADPMGVQPGKVMPIVCGQGGAESGLVWRRTDMTQLRVLAAPPPDKGIDRLAPPDLDCDEHSPGVASFMRQAPGDELDCDDTAAIVHGAGREQCSRLIDNDCRSETTLSSRGCAMPCQSQHCACDDVGVGDSEICLLPLLNGVCMLAGTPTDGANLKPCDGGGPLALPMVLCELGCEVQVGWAPEGVEVGISDQPGQQPASLGRWVSISDRQAILTVHADGTRGFSRPFEILLRIRAGVAVTDHFIEVQLNGGSCGSPSPLMCPGG